MSPTVMLAPLETVIPLVLTSAPLAPLTVNEPALMVVAPYRCSSR